jgi:hypothetical protein
VPEIDVDRPTPLTTVKPKVCEPAAVGPPYVLEYNAELYESPEVKGRLVE